MLLETGAFRPFRHNWARLGGDEFGRFGLGIVKPEPQDISPPSASKKSASRRPKRKRIPLRTLGQCRGFRRAFDSQKRAISLRRTDWLKPTRPCMKKKRSRSEFPAEANRLRVAPTRSPETIRFQEKLTARVPLDGPHREEGACPARVPRPSNAQRGRLFPCRERVITGKRQPPAAAPPDHQVLLARPGRASLAGST